MLTTNESSPKTYLLSNTSKMIPNEDYKVGYNLILFDKPHKYDQRRF